MLSNRFALVLVVTAVVMTGCDDFVRAHIEGTATNPILHLKDDMSIERIEVEKVEYSRSEQVTYIKYWGVVANNKEQRMYSDQVQYGNNPEGWEVYVPAKQLMDGYYLIHVAEVHRVSEAGFLIVKNGEGNLSLIGIDEPYNYSDEFIQCVEAHSYIEDQVKSKCFTERYLRKKGTK